MLVVVDNKEWTDNRILELESTLVNLSHEYRTRLEYYINDIKVIISPFFYMEFVWLVWLPVVLSLGWTNLTRPFSGCQVIRIPVWKNLPLTDFNDLQWASIQWSINTTAPWWEGWFIYYFPLEISKIIMISIVLTFPNARHKNLGQITGWVKQKKAVSCYERDGLLYNSDL